MRTQRWSVAITITSRTSPITTLTSCFLRYAVESPRVRSWRDEVADQTSSPPSTTRASTASISTQSRPGARRAERLIVRPVERAVGRAAGRVPETSAMSVLPGGRQDRAVLHERRDARRRGGAGDRGPARLHLHAVDAVERLPDLAHGRAGGARAGAGLADHHHDDVVLVVGRH